MTTVVAVTVAVTMVTCSQKDKGPLLRRSFGTRDRGFEEQPTASFHGCTGVNHVLRPTQRKEGREGGKEEKKEGRQAGKKEGKEEGQAEGREEGEEGKEEGRSIRERKEGKEGRSVRGRKS